MSATRDFTELQLSLAEFTRLVITEGSAPSRVTLVYDVEDIVWELVPRFENVEIAAIVFRERSGQTTRSQSSRQWQTLWRSYWNQNRQQTPQQTYYSAQRPKTVTAANIWTQQNRALTRTTVTSQTPATVASTSSTTTGALVPSSSTATVVVQGAASTVPGPTGATGATGPQGPQGLPGITISDSAPLDTTVLWLDTSGLEEVGEIVGLPSGGTTDQLLAKTTNTDYAVGWKTLTALDLGLGNVTDQSKETMFTDPVFTGVPRAPTALAGTDSQQIATTAFVAAAVNAATGTLAPLAGAVFTGTTSLQQITETLNTKTGATGTVEHDFSTGAIWYHSSISSDFTANFTNVPTTDNKTISLALILVQGATGRMSTLVEIDGAPVTVRWFNTATPTGTANKVDIVNFTLIRAGAAWTVVGNVSSFG